MSWRGRKARKTSDARTDIGQLGCERRERLRVRGRARANHQVDGRQMRQQLHSYDLAYSSLQLVAIHGAVAMARDDDSNSWKPKRGSELTDVEVPTPNSLPLSNDGFQFALSRQTMLAREASLFVRRRRT